MRYTKLLFPMMMLVASGAVFAAVDDTGMSFDELDQDGDGIISRDEADATPGLSESFDALDANGDGVLDESEVGVGGPDSDLPEEPESGKAAGSEGDTDPDY